MNKTRSHKDYNMMDKGHDLANTSGTHRLKRRGLITKQDTGVRDTDEAQEQGR